MVVAIRMRVRSTQGVLSCRVAAVRVGVATVLAVAAATVVAVSRPRLLDILRIMIAGPFGLSVGVPLILNVCMLRLSGRPHGRWSHFPFHVGTLRQ